MMGLNDTDDRVGGILEWFGDLRLLVATGGWW